MTLLIQLQGGNYFRGNTVDKAVLKREITTSFNFRNVTYCLFHVLCGTKFIKD